MKKKTLALATIAAFATAYAEAQSSVVIYGILDTGMSYANKIAAPTSAAPRATGGKWTLDSGTVQQSRFGFRDTEDLGGGLKAFFNLEGGFSVDSGASGQGGLTFGRTSVVGLAGDFGSVQLGRRKDYTDDISSKYSSVDDYGVFGNGVHDNNLDRYGGNRSNNQIRYDTPDFNGLKLNAMYAFGETAGSISTGQSFGFGANYKNAGFGVGLGYFQAKLGTLVGGVNSSSDQGAGSAAACAPSFGTPGDTCLKTWVIGSSYTIDKLKLRGTLSQVRQPLAVAGAAAPNFTAKFTGAAGSAAFAAGGSNNDKTNIADLGLDCSLDGGLTVTGSLLQSRYDFVGSSVKGRLTQVILGLDYRLSKRTDLYTFASSLRASDMYSPGIIGGAPGANNSSVAMTAGIRHLF